MVGWAVSYWVDESKITVYVNKIRRLCRCEELLGLRAVRIRMVSILRPWYEHQPHCILFMISKVELMLYLL